jgi:hypothetical protein
MKIAWHYTVGSRAKDILESGKIRPATANVPSNERPAVWFTVRDDWEPTANKRWQNSNTGEVKFLSTDEMLKRGGGGVRFGIPVHKLTPWNKLINKTRMDSKTKKALIEFAINVGSDPDSWYGTIKPVRVKDCVIQLLWDGSKLATSLNKGTWGRSQPDAP